MIKPYRRADLAVGVPAARAQVQGALVTLVPARAGDPSQQWVRLTDYTTAKWVNRASGKCLDVAYRSPNNNAPVIQWTCYTTDSQIWTNFGSFGWLHARHARDPDKCLDIEAANATFALKPGVRLSLIHI